MAYRTSGQIAELREHTGQPLRQPAIALFTVDSEDRYTLDADGFRTDNTPINNFIISKPQSLINGYFTRVALTEINFPWAIPNVNPRNNNLKVFDGLQRWTAVIPTGFYEPTDLAAAMQTAMNAAAAAAGSPRTFTCVYNAASQSFTFESPGANNFQIEPCVNSILYTIGFTGILTDPAGIATFGYKITGGYAPMLYTPYFDIVSNQLTKKQNVSDSGSSLVSGRSLLCRVYLTKDGTVPTSTDEAQILGCRPFTIHREFQNPKQIFWDTQEFINIIDLTLLDADSKVLYEEPQGEVAAGVVELGSGGTNWQMTFQVTET